MSDFKIVKLVDPIVVQTNGVNVSLSGNTAGTLAAVSSGTLFLAGGNNITLSQSQNTVSIIGGAGAGGGVAMSAGTQLGSTGTVRFANSNGLTFGMSNSSIITASHNGITSQSIQTQNAVSLLGSTGGISFANDNNITFGGNASTITASASFNQTVQTQNLMTVNGTQGNVTISGGNGVTVGNNASTVTISVATNYQSQGAYLTTAMQSNAVTLSNIKLSAGTQSSNLSAITFADSNGVSFGLDAGTVTATVATNYQSQGAYLTTAALSNHSHGNPTLNLTNLSGTTASASNGFTLSLSANPAGGADGVNILAAGTQTANTTGSVLFSNSNGITFGMSNSSVITASHNGLTTAMASNRGSDFVQANAAFAGTNASGTIASNGISVSVAPPGSGAALKGSGTYTQNTGTVEFANSNGITFGLSNNGTMTASHNGLTTARASNDAIGLNTAQTNVTWTVNSAGISLNAGAYLTTAMASNAATISNINFSAGTTSLNLSKLTFADSNGISFGLSGNSVVTGTVKTDYQSSNPNYLTSQSNQNITAANGGFAFQTLSFSNLNGISFGTSAGSAITASHNGLTTARASTDAIGLNTAGSNMTWTANSSGLSIDARGYAGTGTSATNASVTLNSNGLAISVAAPGGGGALAASASNGSFTFSTLGFSNANNVTFGTSAGSIITASVAAPGAAAENNNINLLGANTAGNTTASGSTIGWSGVNLTLSGTNASQVVVSAPATSSLSATGLVSLSTNGSTISIGVPVAPSVQQYPIGGYAGVTRVAIGNASLMFVPVQPPNVQMDRVVVPVSMAVSSSSNSSHAGTISMHVGIYTKSGSSLSLSVSGSQTWAWTNTSSNSMNSLNGLRQFTVPLTASLSQGIDYWVGFLSRTSTANANWFSASNLIYSQDTIVQSGMFMSASASTNQSVLGIGIYSATQSTLPSSAAFSQIGSNAWRSVPQMIFMSSTI